MEAPGSQPFFSTFNATRARTALGRPFLVARRRQPCPLQQGVVAEPIPLVGAVRSAPQKSVESTGSVRDVAAPFPGDL